MQTITYTIRLFLYGIFFILFVISCSKKQPEKQFDKTNGKKVQSNKSFYNFTPIKPSSEDKVILPNGFKYDVLISYKDPINNKGDYFGNNNDHIEFLPIDGLSSGNSSNDGYLFVNHEYEEISGLKNKSEEQIKHEKYNVGVSIFRVRKENNKWKIILDDKNNRRISALTKINVDGPAKDIIGQTVIGTMDNCSGGQTSWGTVLSGEESLTYGSDRGWKDFKADHIGWMVEIDPYDASSTPVKHTAMGRFRHENAAMIVSKSGKVIVYMGEDTDNGGFYKFISKEKFIKGDRKHNMTLLSQGILYGLQVENTKNLSGKGKWIPIDINDPNSGSKLKKAGYTSQGQVLIDTHKLLETLSISKLDRPEDCEIHPLDKSIYLALTKNKLKKPKNQFGMIWRIVEDNNDHESLKCRYETFAKGGIESGFSQPDNLLFDSKGNLWVATDISSASLNKGIYKSFRNNGFFMFKTSGSDKGKAKQFLSPPKGAESTGPWFTPDEKNLFLSIQHPGEGGQKSTWPTGKIPKPSVIVIRREE